MTATPATQSVSPLTAWRMAVRVPTLTAAVAPVAVGTGLAIYDDVFRLLPALAALLGALCLQAGANFANDVFDFERGADNEERLGPPRATQLGLLSPARMKAGMWTAFALATLAGVYLVAVAGWPVIAVGLASIAAAIVYTGGPWPIGYHALGDAFTFVFFGLVAVVGAYFVQAGEVTRLAFGVAIPVGCTVTQILVVNNLRDIETDRRSGKRTLAVLLGDRRTRLWFAALMVAAWLVPVALYNLPFVWLAVPLSLPFGLPVLREVMGRTSGRALNPVLKATARHHLVFGLLLALGLALS